MNKSHQAEQVSMAPTSLEGIIRHAPPPRRIAVVLSALAAGGSERVISLLVNHWAAQGRDVTLISFDTRDTPPFFPIDQRVDLRQLGLASGQQHKLASLMQMTRRVRILRTIFREKKPDLILSFLTKINVLTMIASRGLKIPVIVSERNNPQRQGFARIWVLLRNLLYPSAARLVAMTKRAIDAIPANIRPVTSVIPNPVVLPEGWQVRRGSKRLVAVGRLVEQKGFDLLIEAFSRIAKELPDWRLVIWGEGPLRMDLERQRDKLGLGSRVSLPGVTTRPGLWVEDADVFVLSSRFEGWGIALTEAMAAGLPAVSFDCPFGPAEMITSGVDGILVPPEDVSALAEVLRTVMSDAAMRERLGNAGRESSRRFQAANVLAAWDDVVAETCRRY
jgi:glycosyltransferase involved in cell wall biosynthesis